MVVCLIRGEIVLLSMAKAAMAKAMTHESRGEGSLLPQAVLLEQRFRRVEPAESLEVAAPHSLRSIRLNLNS